MALLTDEQRRKVHGMFSTATSHRRVPIGSLSKTDVRAAVDAIDDWVEDNMGAFNQALPEPARTELPTRLKVELLHYVMKIKWEIS